MLYLISLGVWTLLGICNCKQNNIFESGTASILRLKHGEASIQFGRNVNRWSDEMLAYRSECQMIGKVQKPGDPNKF
jgi:hypothetical protein